MVPICSLKTPLNIIHGVFWSKIVFGQKYMLLLEKSKNSQYIFSIQNIVLDVYFVSKL